MTSKWYSQENLVLFWTQKIHHFHSLSPKKNLIYNSDDKCETRNLYDCKSESDNLDFICQNYILLTFK